VRAADSGRLVLATLILLQAAVQMTPGSRSGATPPKPTFAANIFDPVVSAGIRRGAYPGAALAVGRADTVLFLNGYGRLTWTSGSAPVDPDGTMYDLASLTKVVVTATAIMILVDRSKVRLDAPVATYVPEFTGPGTAGITVRQLLSHTSGLRADLPIDVIRGAADAAALLRLVCAETPRVPPGTRVVYSDVNAVLLGEVVRRTSGEPLDAFAAREIFGPLGLRDSGFRPPGRLASRIAPTGVWRGRPVAGIVNDPTAAKLGGVAGHAGLFATARDVARFAQFILRGGVTGDGRRLIRAETMRAFTSRVVYFGTGEGRALGWQAIPTGERVSSAGSRFGEKSFGHTGWTGTSLWIDPERDLFVVLLTNRAFAPRSREPFTVLKEVRGKLADAAADASDAEH